VSQGEEAVVESIGRDQGADDHCGKDQLLDVGENRLADFMLGLGEQDGARGIEQGRQQQVFQAAGIDQPDRVDQGDPPMIRSLCGPGIGLVGLAAQRQQQRIGRRPQYGTRIIEVAR
jgi:hypothetical protein